MKKIDWKLIGIYAGSILAVICVCVFWIQSFQNKAFNLEERVQAAYNDIKVQEKRRVDLVYNMADCVGQYDNHEKETLLAIADSNKSEDIENVTNVIRAIGTAYPELKSSELYKELMTELSTTENLIANYRENYNKQRRAYNTFVKGFPARGFLNMLGYERQEYAELNLGTEDTTNAPQNLFD